MGSYEHLLNILESRRVLYLQIIRLEVLLYEIVYKEIMPEIR